MIEPMSEPDEADHSRCVDDWMEGVASGLPPERLVQAFEKAFSAIWQRAHLTLGDVTLTAILDRVLYTAAERFPLFSSLKVEATGLGCQEFRERASTLPEHELRQGIRFVLLEFLTVLGNLTSNILTPALHAELSKARAEARDPDEKRADDHPRSGERTRIEDAES